MSGVFNSLRSLDVYPKLSEEYKVRTASGAAISIAAIIFMGILFISELSFYLTTQRTEHLVVDLTTEDKIQINFDFFFDRVPCSLLTLDVMDVSGEQTIDLDHNVMKKPVDHQGNEIGGVIKHDVANAKKLDEKKVIENHGEDEEEKKPSEGKNAAVRKAELDHTDERYCGSCYGAEEKEGDCCNTCVDVERAYQKKGWAFLGGSSVEQCVRHNSRANDDLSRHEGCKMVGHLLVNKVAGNFHFAPGHGFQNSHVHVHDTSALKSGAFNVSHTINRLSFGTEFPGILNPLDQARKVVESGAHIYQYFVKVVPTTYKYLNGTQIETNQFSVTEHVTNIKAREGHGLPGVFIFYEMSPIKVIMSEERKSFLHFITQLCAIIGGVFTVAGLVDRILYSSLVQMEKVQLGKLG